MTAENRILVIDDNIEIHKDFQKVLCGNIDGNKSSAFKLLAADLLGEEAPQQKQTFQLDFANQGQAGLDMVKQALADGLPYAVAFVDVRMPPGIDGINTIKNLWQLDNNLQAVITTAYSDYNWDDITKILGSTDRLLILKKPFENIEIRQMASALCEKWNLINKMKSINESLIVSKARYADLYNNSPDMYLSVYPETGLIRSCNQTTANKLGYKKEEIEGQLVTKFYHPDCLEDVSKILNTFSLTGHVENAELKIITKEGNNIDVNININPVRDDDGNILYSRSCWVDITESKQLEEILRQSQKMEAIGQLTGGIAHDFNNILAIILGNLSLFKSQVESDNPFHKRLETIEKAAERAAKLTKQLLSFSRIQPKKNEQANLNIIIKEMQNLIFRSMTPEIKIDTLFADDLWNTKIDIGDFEDVFLNLILNARDAIEGHGQLIIETRNTILDKLFCETQNEVVAGEYVELLISDNGKGIAQDKIEHIFEPFYTTKILGKGTGLGLAMVHSFVKRSGGHISCESEVNVGSTFKIYLPAETKDIQSSEALTGGTETILIVDDEPQLTELATEILTTSGYHIVCAKNGRQALKLLNKNSDISLVVSDIVMPDGINGYELAQKISQQYPDTKILLCSGYAADSENKNNQHHYHMLSKPYSSSELIKMVREILDVSLN